MNEIYIPYSDPACGYTGRWQEDGKGAILGYNTVGFCTIGFTGECITVDGDLTVGQVQFYIDGKEAEVQKDKGWRLCATPGRHVLQIKLYQRGRLRLRGFSLPANESAYKAEERHYVLFIGDSITEACPGYSNVAPVLLDWDYATVALGGMSLVDGWGWYALPEGMTVRRGMETQFFQLEYPQESDNETPYTFTYCRQPDEIVLFLGTNDYLDNERHHEAGHVAIFAAHYAAFVDRVREKYPHARLILLQALSDKFCRREGIRAAYERIRETHPEVLLLQSDTWGVELCDDNTHPSEAGYRHMGERLAAELRRL